MLAAFNSRIEDALGQLSVTNPFERSALETISEEEPARRALASACSGAPDEIRERLQREYFDAGPLVPLLSDSDVTEIIVNGPDSIWVERRGSLSMIEDRFLTALTYRNFVARLCREAQIIASLDCPFADGVWRGCRVHLIIPPASGEHAVVTLRRHPENPWTLDRLKEREWASASAIDALKALIRDHRNFLVIGGTGSGKTSVLNACLGEIESSARVVTIEDTSELKLPNRASTKLLTRRDPQGHLREIDQSELLKQALRMRPDRIVLGEIRGGEAKDLLMAFATGHKGCMGTMHADSARQALIRLEMLVQLGAPQWNLHAVRSLIWLSLNAVVVVGRTESGERKLDGIYRIASLEEIGFLIEKMA
ncbi:MAG TPA: ATPase, T2SS/T4P/T4SS family [Bdellovibrionales bacterium]|nr:ATPase, T2SS/T4P/T4SS family [Bdellovibrionales bacterium]